MYELKKLERHLRVNLLGPGSRLMKKRIYQAAVSQRLRNTALHHIKGIDIHAMKVHMGAEVLLHSFVTPTLDEGKWITLHSPVSAE